MQPKKIKFDSSRFKIESENEAENVLKIKINFDTDNPQEQIEQLNKNQVLLKAAQNFFKEKTGDEQKPVKDSIRIFNNFRIRSNSPQHQKLNYKESIFPPTNLAIGESMAQIDEKKIEQANIPQSQHQIMNQSIIKNMVKDGQSTQYVQQNNQSQKLNQSQSKQIEISQSPTKKLQLYRDMRDEVQVRMTNKQSKIKQERDKQASPDREKERKNKSEWILQQISKFSPQQVLKLEDPIILQAIKNLDLSVEEMKEWIQVSDFYSIQESTRMQMRRYLTALNETFYKIESVIQERDRIQQQKIKELNSLQAQNKIDKFFQSYSNSKYYREFDAMKSYSTGKHPMQWKSENNKSDYINSISFNLGGELLEGSNQFNSNMLVEENNPNNNESLKKLKNSDPQFKVNKLQNPSYSPQKVNQNSEHFQQNQPKVLKRQGTLNSGRNLEDIQQKHAHLNSQSPCKDTQQNHNIHMQFGESLNERLEEEGNSSINKEEVINTNQQVANDSNSFIKQKEIQRQKFTKVDLQKKLQQKQKIEQRLTNLQLNEALQYEEDQEKLQVAIKKKKLLSNQRRQKEIQNKVDKIKQRNNYVDERKSNYDKWKIDDENRRYETILKMQSDDSHLQSIKEKKEEIKFLMAFERDKQAQLKQQVLREQQKLNTDELIKRNRDDYFRIQESIEIKNTKKQGVLQSMQDKAKTSNEQKAQIVHQQYQQQKIIQEQIAAEVAKKYDISAEFLDQLQKQRDFNIIEINREFDRRQRENDERLQNIQTQENLLKAKKTKLLSARISSSEMQRKERIENLKKQISQNNLNKANKTMQSFYQTRQQFIERGDKYLKEEHDNRDAYLDDVKTYQQYLKKCAAIRINQSYQREELISSPKKIRNVAYQLKNGQFKKIDHSF